MEEQRSKKKNKKKKKTKKNEENGDSTTKPTQETKVERTMGTASKVKDFFQTEFANAENRKVNMVRSKA